MHPRLHRVLNLAALLVVGLTELGLCMRAGEAATPAQTPANPQHWSSNNHPFKERDFLYVAKACKKLQVVDVSAYGRWYAMEACRLPSNDDHPDIGVDEVLYDNDDRVIGFKRRIRLQSTQEILQQGYYTSVSMDSVQCSKFMELGLPVITVVRRRYCEAMLNGEI